MDSAPLLQASPRQHRTPAVEGRQDLTLVPFQQAVDKRFDSMEEDRREDSRRTAMVDTVPSVAVLGTAVLYLLNKLDLPPWRLC